MAVYLAPADYIDSDHALITARARQLCGDTGAGSYAARAIYYFVRDLRYEGSDFEDLETYGASSVLAAGQGYCVGKAACARRWPVPPVSRPGSDSTATTMPCCSPSTAGARR